jgi:hypothetical protein
MLLLGLDFGGVTFPWPSSKTICLIVFGLAMITLFLASEAWLSKDSVMPLRICQDRSRTGALLVTFCHSFVSRSYFCHIVFNIPNTELRFIYRLSTFYLFIFKPLDYNYRSSLVP